MEISKDFKLLKTEMDFIEYPRLSIDYSNNHILNLRKGDNLIPLTEKPINGFEIRDNNSSTKIYVSYK